MTIFQVTLADSTERRYTGESSYSFDDGGVLTTTDNDGKKTAHSPAFWQTLTEEAAEDDYDVMGSVQ